MTRMTFPVPPNAPAGSYAAGWNARHAGREFRHHETDDWKIGWTAADEVPATERRAYNDTAAISQRVSVARAS